MLLDGGYPISLSLEPRAAIQPDKYQLEDCPQSMKSKRDSIPLEHWIGYRFSRIASRIGNFVAPMYESRHDLTMPAWRSLAVIARYQPLTAKQLAALTSSDAFKVARAIELLARRGLISRDVDGEDRRRVQLSLTAKGRAIYDDVEKFTIRVEKEITAGLSSDELKVLRRVLDTIDNRLEENVRSKEWHAFLDE
jgi:DNA-binding MarR family transcriptional regulator